MYISNDLKIVDEALRTYYSMQPEQYCDECKAPILSDGKRTVKQIIDGTTKITADNSVCSVLQG